jgi:hypothetical protein
MSKVRPKSVNPPAPAGGALQTESEQPARTGRKPRTSKKATSDVPQPPPSGSNENAGSQEISPEERRRLIEEAAYHCSQRRHREGRYGTPEDDWAEAEAEVERMLAERRKKKS